MRGDAPLDWTTALTKRASEMFNPVDPFRLLNRKEYLYGIEQ